MKRQTLKVLFAAVVCYLGACIANYIGELPPSTPLTYAPMSCGTAPWSVWDYLTMGSFMFGVGLTVAAIKLIALRQVIPRKQKLLDL